MASSFETGVSKGIDAALCAVIRGTGAGLYIFSRLPGGSVLDRSIQRLEQARRARCSDNNAPPPPRGGACDCVKYTVTLYARRYTLSSGRCVPSEGTVTATLWGPISEISLEQGAAPSTGNWFLRATSKGQATSAVCSTLASRLHGSLLSSDQCPAATLTGIKIVRADGQPNAPCDEVDFPIPPPPPGWNIIINQQINYTNNNNTNVTEFGDFKFGFAYVDADFDVKIPVEIELPDITLKGNFNIEKGAFEFDFDANFDIDFNARPQVRGPDGDDREQPEPAEDSDDIEDIEPDDRVIEDDDDPDEPDDPTDTVPIVAARVVVNQIRDGYSKLYQEANPNIGIPNYGHINFYIRISETSGAWTSDIPVKNTNNFIPCPWPKGAIAVRGTPQPGVEFSILALRNLEGKRVTIPN